MSLREVTVARTWRETPVLQGIVLDAPPVVRAEHTKPGQLISVPAPDGSDAYLALASTPGADALELLVTDRVCADLGFSEGRALGVAGPFGPGFPLESARGKDVLLFAVGSALAPIKPLIEMIRADRSAYGRVSLFVGAVSDEAFAYRDRYEAWMRDRVDVVRALHPQWVQDVFAADPLPLDDSVAFVCGMSAMMEGVTETLSRFGLDREHVYRNW